MAAIPPMSIQTALSVGDPVKKGQVLLRLESDYQRLELQRTEAEVARANLAEKGGDDFAARVYVFFDVPVESLPLGARAKALVARVVWGEKLPSAAICYVWDNRHPPGTGVWNPYTDRVRTVVLRSGSPGAWAAESRDLAADFRAAFGAQWSGPVPRVTGIAIGNDTDQTGEAVTAWFGDFRLEARR